MLYFVLLALALFGLAAILGWYKSTSRSWVWVDVVYYPLVACGVVIFFYEVEGTRAAFVLDSIETFHAALQQGLLGAFGATELAEVTEAALSESRENLAAVEARRESIATVQGIRSIAWPAIVLIALSLKFAKGVAAYKSSKRTPQNM